jgi:hypothetical protein
VLQRYLFGPLHLLVHGFMPCLQPIASAVNAQEHVTLQQLTLLLLLLLLLLAAAAGRVPMSPAQSSCGSS